MVHHVAEATSCPTSCVSMRLGLRNTNAPVDALDLRLVAHKALPRGPLRHPLLLPAPLRFALPLIARSLVRRRTRPGQRLDPERCRSLRVVLRPDRLKEELEWRESRLEEKQLG